MATTADTDAMRRAVALAARGLGATSPNPVVGCVVRDASGHEVGAGHHERAGGPHAEVNALRRAGVLARGGTAYVTLEPCNHTGRTGPCAQALIEAGIARVVYAVADPDPVAGGGAETLRAAGIRVEHGLLAAEAEEGNAAWLTSVRLGRPYVTWKYAAGLDGRVAAADGTSRWISSAESRADVHRLRAEADAVVVGSGTARADDPHLAVRGVDGAVQPLRVVVDTEGTAVRPGARVLDGAAPTLIAVAEDTGRTDSRADSGRTGAEAEVTGRTEGAGAAGGTGVEWIRLPRAAAGGLSVPALLAALHERGVRSVLLEGGPTLAGAFVAAGAVDRVIGYLAPLLLGAGPAVLNDAGITTLAGALRLDVREAVRLGPDLRITATVARPAVPAAGPGAPDPDTATVPAAQDPRTTGPQAPGPHPTRPATPGPATADPAAAGRETAVVAPKES
ncbi:bifunctional diaminohydroxyphosphoribosylaminopyrimidine deaminase/5-amino-6-(5-phosphoribosylamino)uracil reductase RibD [Streptomyces sp. LP05-1]|uniref:Riboflavin biosynthesis protein RibD n=1 Tax=Streptomyces pyxinae TaxID=2970734 RepID=A0ABT2CQ23_9ACTN|nr:bifunctional diaminohydroxyphosphoribosylaminopyrimidine deaminase/5-amino-6-(5-phosphoribosylamino)uracil reductase RibD [Streptomyces sp. LP05-1]MCS0639528.1 bifunctional diaminohydroxyphosphoribosylaminopyrimidine deaminase/5-amino-6-(5-phosphoribosylamino)uracil reductase RibD [Streptomyces sp. LP05-1]